MDKLDQFLNLMQLDLTGEKLVVAVSGGPDSMALVDMLKDHYQLVVAHFDHQLRPQSYLETNLLAEYCQKYNLELVTEKWQHGPLKAGVEAKARTARYDFLKRVCQQKQAKYLLTAHHSDDYLENILIKLLRSGDINEMASLKLKGKMGKITILRPLIFYQKSELLAYVKAGDLPYIDDETNFEDDTLRNRLRHYVVPKLKQENPDLSDQTRRFAMQAEVNNEFAEKICQLLPLEPFLGQWRIQKNKLADFSSVAIRRYFELQIYRHYHQRCHLNDELTAGAFSLIAYQNYYYLINQAEINFTAQKKVILERPFSFSGRRYLLSLNREAGNLIAKFSAPKELTFGSIKAEKLLLKNGQHAKNKKFFAQAQIPALLRSQALTFFAQGVPVWVENSYCNQIKSKDFLTYYLFLLN